jgi:SAM-dependent methyltransferase
MSYPQDDDAYSYRPALEDWYRSELGQLLLERETALLAERLGPLFGYYLLQLSALVSTDLSAASKIRHRFQFAASVEQPGRSGAVSQFEALPLESDSIDVVVLHHVLEFSRHPHQILREAHRVLMPRGHLLLIGINPFSLFGLRTRVMGSVRASPWCGHMISPGRMMDWLSLLDMRVTEVKQAFHHIPVQAPRLLRKLDGLWNRAERHSLPFGGIYLIEARKQMIGLTPQKPRWRVWRPELVPLGAASSRLPSSNKIH